MLDIVGLLQTEKNDFTRSERALTDIVLADVDSVLKMSIVDLAAQADVSPPTVTRFCRRLGCDSYADFKVRLAQSRFVGQRYFAPAAGPTSVREIAQSVVNGIQSIIYETFEHLDFAAVERAAESVAKSNFILSFGSGGASSMMAGEIETRFFRLGLKVASTDDHQLQLMRVAAAPAGTVIVAFSLSGPIGENPDGCRGIRPDPRCRNPLGLDGLSPVRHSPAGQLARERRYTASDARSLRFPRHGRRARPDRRHPSWTLGHRQHAPHQAPARRHA
jgi:hypothetical protein